MFDFGWTKIFISLLIHPDIPADDERHCSSLGISPLVTDEKALYDASRSESAGLGLTEKRTAIEVMILNERLKALRGVWKLTNAFQQLADGLTKIEGRQGLAESLRRGCHSLKFDPSYARGGDSDGRVAAAAGATGAACAAVAARSARAGLSGSACGGGRSRGKVPCHAVLWRIVSSRGDGRAWHLLGLLADAGGGLSD